MSEQQQKPSLYERLGGYDAVYAFAGEVLKTCMKHPDIGHIWAHVSESSFQKEHINFVDFLCKHWGGNTTATAVRDHGFIALTSGWKTAVYDTFVSNASGLNLDINNANVCNASVGRP